jgi:hypothetical protein
MIDIAFETMMLTKGTWVVIYQHERTKHQVDIRYHVGDDDVPLAKYKRHNHEIISVTKIR